MKNEFAPESEMDAATSNLWDRGVQDFLKKGGLASTGIKYPLNVSPDLESHLPTFGDLAKMDIHVEWVIEKLLPESAITVLHAKGGGLKTFLSLQLGARVADGLPFVGLATKKMPTYYCDFENSMAVLCDRARILGPQSEMRIWHLSNDFPPPRLDSKDDWKLFKALKPGLLIFDTLRSAQLLDENSSKDMALVMGRLKELREFGFTILLIHHSPKADDRAYKGSTAISDLADHTLHLEKVRSIDSDVVVNEEDDDNNLPFRLGPRGKTRYEKFSIYLEFKPDRGFFRAGDPDEANLSEMQDFIIGYFKAHGDHPNQKTFQNWAKAEMDLKKAGFRHLLSKGKGKYWEEVKGPKNSTFYRQILFSKFEEKREEIQFSNSERKTEIMEGANGIEITEFSSFPEGSQKTQKTASDPVFQFSKPLEGWKTQKTEINGSPLKEENEELPGMTDREFDGAIHMEDADEGE